MPSTRAITRMASKETATATSRFLAVQAKPLKLTRFPHRSQCGKLITTTVGQPFGAVQSPCRRTAFVRKSMHRQTLPAPTDEHKLRADTFELTLHPLSGIIRSPPRGQVTAPL